jgi:hypothetical protein
MTDSPHPLSLSLRFLHPKRFLRRAGLEEGGGARLPPGEGGLVFFFHRFVILND